MRRALLLAAASLTAITPAAAATRGEAWWAHVEALASDAMRGRVTGSDDYLRAADYVVGQFKRLGLAPAGTEGFLQPVNFIEQAIVADKSHASLIGEGGTTLLRLPGDLIVSGGGGPAPSHIDAPLVFAGYGLHIPEAGHDDFAGLDVKGKIVVVISGGPAEISGALKSHARSERAKLLAERGAVGIITLTSPKQIEVPWSRRMVLAPSPAMFLADAGSREVKTPFFSGTFNTDSSELLFAGSGHSFGAMAELADASKPVPAFPLAVQLQADIVATQKPATSPNIVARFEGSDPKLKSEYVVLSAHLDGYGVGAPIDGDTIYNGAMDDASGVATLIEIAAKLRADKARPKRSILFVIVTAEEKGLLGSRYFSQNPTVPRGSVVADLNFDMPLPLWPLRNVIVLGADESTIGAEARAVGAARGLPLVPDPLPDRNSFTRSDQYSYVRVGIPAVAFKFGFARGTPEEQIEKTWRATRYHAPSDDIAQPVEKEEAVKLNDFVADLALRVANMPVRPAWLPGSFFARFAK